ncbi:roadblock/LC7 domain-containing protein [Streptomyces physcomitrii]|uniref:roadblock/LC7 domain-containing protein n=1 Tax=Streptomyces physcomitrii TaxID=2724184 RepID=UPI0033D01A7E
MTTPDRRAQSTPLAEAPDYSEQAEKLLQQRHDLAAVVFLSTDGLIAGAGGEVDREQAETTAASASGLYSLGRESLAVVAGGGARARSVTIEGEDGRFLLIVAAGDNLRIAAFTQPDPDLGGVMYELAKLADTFALHISSRGDGR